MLKCNPIDSVKSTVCESMSLSSVSPLPSNPPPPRLRPLPTLTFFTSIELFEGFLLHRLNSEAPVYNQSSSDPLCW